MEKAAVFLVLDGLKVGLLETVLKVLCNDLKGDGKSRRNLILVQKLKKVKPKKAPDKDMFSSLSAGFLRLTFKMLSTYFLSSVLVRVQSFFY